MVPTAQLARLMRRARSSDDPSSSSSSSSATQKSTSQLSALQKSAPQISSAAAATAAEDLNAVSDAELARRKREMDLNFTANLLRPGDAGYAYVLFFLLS